MVFSMFAKFQRKVEDSPFSVSHYDPGFPTPYLGHPDLILHCQEGRCLAHQAVLVRSSSFIRDLMQEQHMDCVASRRIGVDIHIPDLEVNIINKLLAILYTGATVLEGLQETTKLKAAWKLLRIDVIQIKELEIVFETPDSFLPSLDSKNTSLCKEKDNGKRKRKRGRNADKKLRMNMKVKKRINLKKLRKKKSKKFVKGLEEFIVQTIEGKERQVETIETKSDCRKSPENGSNTDQGIDKYSASFMENLVYTSPSNLDFAENDTILAPFKKNEHAPSFCDKLRPSEQVGDSIFCQKQHRTKEVDEPLTLENNETSSALKEKESNQVPTPATNHERDELFKSTTKEPKDLRHNSATSIQMGFLPQNQRVNNEITSEAVEECQYKGNDNVGQCLDSYSKTKDIAEEPIRKTREYIENAVSKKELRETVKTIVKETIQIKSPTEILNFNDQQTLQSSSLASRIMRSSSTGGMGIDKPLRFSNQISPAFLEHSLDSSSTDSIIMSDIGNSDVSQPQPHRVDEVITVSSLASFSDVVAAVGLQPMPRKRPMPPLCPLLNPEHVDQRKIASESPTSVCEEGQMNTEKNYLSDSPLLLSNSTFKDPLIKNINHVDQKPKNSNVKYDDCDTETKRNENTIELVQMDDTGYVSDGNDSDSQNGTTICLGLSLDSNGNTMKSIEPKKMILSEKHLKGVSGDKKLPEIKSVEERMPTGVGTTKDHAAKEITHDLGNLKVRHKSAVSSDSTTEAKKGDCVITQTVPPARECHGTVNKIKGKANSPKKEDDHSTSQCQVEAKCQDKDVGCIKDIIKKGPINAPKPEQHPFKFNARNMLLSQTMLVHGGSTLTCNKTKHDTSSGKQDKLSTTAQPGQCSNERKQPDFHHKSLSLYTEETRGFSSFPACDTDGMALIPDIQDLNDCPDILESLMSVLESPSVSNDNDCVEESMIKIPLDQVTRKNELHKDQHTGNRPMMKFKAPQKQPKYRPKYNNEKSKFKNIINSSIATPIQEKRKKKLTKEFSEFFKEENQADHKRKTGLIMEKPRYVLNHNIININSYKQNQSKLKIINRNKIDYSNFIFDKSNDVSLRKKFNIKKDIFVKLPNTNSTAMKPKLTRKTCKQKLKLATLVTNDLASRTANCIVRSKVPSQNIPGPVGIIVENSISDKEKDTFKIPKLKIKICRA